MPKARPWTIYYQGQIRYASASTPMAAVRKMLPGYEWTDEPPLDPIIAQQTCAVVQQHGTTVAGFWREN